MLTVSDLTYKIGARTVQANHTNFPVVHDGHFALIQYGAGSDFIGQV
jgi:hypothetical protein